MYPPGYSLLLSLFLEAGQPMSVNSYRLEVVSWLAGGATLLMLAFCLFVSELPAWASSALLLAFGTSITFTQLTISLSPDILLVAGTCALALLVYAYNSKTSGPKLTAWWFCASVLTAALCVFKSAALAYIAGLVAYGLWKGDLRRLSRIACFVIPPGAMALWVLAAKGVSTYATTFRGSSFVGLVGYFLNSIALALVYGSQRWLVDLLLNVPSRSPMARAFHSISAFTEGMVFLAGLIVFALPLFFGIRKSLRQRSDQIMLFILGAYALELCLWPYYDGARFGAPLIPFIAVLLWRGLASRAAQAVFVAVLILNIPGNAWLSYKITRSVEQQARQNLADLRQAAAWINETAGTTSLVAAGRDVPLTHLYEYLGRRLLGYAGPNSANNYWDVYPTATGRNPWADLLITDDPSHVTGDAAAHYKIDRRFGQWIIMTPR